MISPFWSKRLGPPKNIQSLLTSAYVISYKNSITKVNKENFISINWKTLLGYTAEEKFVMERKNLKYYNNEININKNKCNSLNKYENNQGCLNENPAN